MNKPSLDVTTKIKDDNPSRYTPSIKNDDIPSLNSIHCGDDKTNKKSTKFGLTNCIPW